MTDPIGTAQERELIEHLRRSAKREKEAIEQFEGKAFPLELTRHHQAADALQSRIAEVGRLTEALHEAKLQLGDG